MINKMLRHTAPALILLACVSSAFGQAATTTSVGSGWGENPSPELLSSRPILGQTALLFAMNCQPSSVSYFAVSAPPASSQHIGNGFYFHVDLSVYLTYGPLLTDAGGTLLFPLLLDFPPSSSGDEVILQLLTVYTSSLPDFMINLEVTNGVLWKFGTF
ncbi:MAG: hypothetical protein CMJ83_18395 [Planctomycetes bacterium]|nr:hypothetical protein [Planctomycetota bacterium]